MKAAPKRKRLISFAASDLLWLKRQALRLDTSVTSIVQQIVAAARKGKPWTR